MKIREKREGTKDRKKEKGREKERNVLDYKLLKIQGNVSIVIFPLPHWYHIQFYELCSVYTARLFAKSPETLYSSHMQKNSSLAGF